MKTKFDQLASECVDVVLDLQRGGITVTDEMIENITDENAPFIPGHILAMAVEDLWIACDIPQVESLNELEPIVLMRKNIRQGLRDAIEEVI